MHVDAISFHKSRIDEHEVHLNTIPGRTDFTIVVSTGMTRVGHGQLPTAEDSLSSDQTLKRLQEV